MSHGSGEISDIFPNGLSPTRRRERVLEVARLLPDILMHSGLLPETDILPEYNGFVDDRHDGWLISDRSESVPRAMYDHDVRLSKLTYLRRGDALYIPTEGGLRTCMAVQAGDSNSRVVTCNTLTRQEIGLYDDISRRGQPEATSGQAYSYNSAGLAALLGTFVEAAGVIEPLREAIY